MSDNKQFISALHMQIEEIIIDTEGFWFTLSNSSGLFHCNKDGKVECKANIFEKESGEERLFSSIKKYKDQIIFVPLFAKNIYIYNTVTSDIMKVPFKMQVRKKDIPYNNIHHFMASVIYDGKIYMLPHKYPAIVEMDINTYEIKYYDDWVEKLTPYIKDDKDIYCRKDFCQRENVIYIPFCCANVILMFDLITKISKIMNISDIEEGFSSIVTKEDGFLLSARNTSTIYEWNYKEDKYEKYTLPKEFNDYIISNIRIVEGNIVIFPKYLRDPILIKKQDEFVCLNKLNDLDITDDYKGWLYPYLPLTDDGGLVYVNALEGEIEIYDFDNGKNENIKMYMSVEDRIRWAKYRVDNGCEIIKPLQYETIEKGIAELIATIDSNRKI